MFINMITEVKTKTVKCYNCSTVWQYDNEDVQESVIYDPRHGELKIHLLDVQKTTGISLIN